MNNSNCPPPPSPSFFFRVLELERETERGKLQKDLEHLTAELAEVRRVKSAMMEEARERRERDEALLKEKEKTNALLMKEVGE